MDNQADIIEKVVKAKEQMMLYWYHSPFLHAMLNLSNIITLLRLLLVIPVVACYLIPFDYHRIVSAGLFAFAASLDWVDGYVARKMNEESSLGAALDHISDKILIAAVLIAITYQVHSLIITICTILIVIRELFIAGLREYMSDMGHRDAVKVGWLGKVKTTLQMATVLLILALEPFSLPMLLGELLMISVVVVTLISAWSYLPDISFFTPKSRNTEETK